MTPQLTELDIKDVFPNPAQPRTEFNQEKLEELAGSIKSYGVLEPIVVTPRKGRHMIIAGERRWRASQIAGLTKIPTRIIEADDALVEELALLENIQRQDLNIIEEGKAYKRLLDRGYTVEALAKKLGYKKTGPIYDRLSLLTLNPRFQEMTIKGELSPLQAYEMSRVPEAQQDMVYRKIASGELNTYNKLFAFVTGLLQVQSQEDIFALTPLTADEAATVSALDMMVGTIERTLEKFAGKNMKHLEKAAFHTTVSTNRIDKIISSLQKVRRVVLVGEGVKKAQAEQREA